MSESLNRAFIKAYDKEKLSEAKRKQLAEERESRRVSELMMHFDTATVAIPSPHMLNARAEKAQVPVGPPVPTREASSHNSSSHSPASESRPAPAPVLAEVPPTDESLRDSIASQMLKAGTWQDQQIDAFIGGFPMLSQVYSGGPRAAAKAAEIEAAPSGKASAEIPAKIPAEKPAEIRQVETLEAPAAPALSSEVADSPEAPAKVPVVNPDNLAAQIDQKNREGVIFRLDRPSYSKLPKVEAAPQPGREMLEDDDESEAQSSILGDNSSSLETLALSDNPGHDAGEDTLATVDAKTDSTSGTAASTRAVEENLRQAKMRIFNPVWEVDSLQWPPVCVELLDQMNHKMNRVASNLISACEEGLQILAVTSPQSGEGTTTVACCLALLAGGHGLNVAILDGDIDKPTLSYQTNLDVENDWLSAILNQLPLEEVAVHSIDDQVTLVPLLNPVSPQDIEADDERIASMIRELSESFDLVIVDMGTMNSTRSLVATLGEKGLINAAVAVIDHRSSTSQTIENCLRQIRQAGITSIGLVENFAA